MLLYGNFPLKRKTYIIIVMCITNSCLLKLIGDCCIVYFV